MWLLWLGLVWAQDLGQKPEGVLPSFEDEPVTCCLSRHTLRGGVQVAPLRRCYEQALARGELGSVRAVLVLGIDPISGQVSGARLAPPTPDHDFDACLLQAVGRWDFTPEGGARLCPRASELQLRYPLRFEPRVEASTPPAPVSPPLRPAR